MSQDNRFKDLNRELLGKAESALSTWFPNGLVRGREFVMGDIYGSKGDSLSVNMDKGVWSDFASGESGADLISLYAKSRGLSQGQALNELGGKKATSKKEIKERITYKYTDDYWIDRVDYVDGTKQFFGNYGGAKKHHPVPRPLYFVEGFNPKKAILITEGEKAAHAAHQIIGNHYNVITWPAGSNSWNSANWELLFKKGAENLKVLIWPDCDDVGFKCAAGIANKLKSSGFEVSILDVRKNNPLENIKGWDAHDMLALKWEQQKFIDWAKTCKVDVLDAPKEEPKPKEKKEKTPELKPITDVQVIEDQKFLDRIPEKQSSEIDESNICHFQSIPGIETTSSGKIISNTVNVRTVLNFHPSFKNKFFYDEFYGNIFVVDKGKLRKIRDVDVINATMFMQKAGLDKISKGNVNDAIDSIADENRISQPRIEINKYEWDGVPRIHKFFTDYMESKYPKEYLEAVGKNFWISIVARIYRPGCKVDNMVVIESEREGIFKSTALKVIGGNYKTESTGKLGSKEFVENSLGFFLIEDDELVATKGVSAEQQRAYISRATDTFRKAYGRFSNDQPRQWIMVGTTNNDKYIDAENSDGRRFWPIKTHKVNIEDIIRDREQLFAEARERFKKGEEWWSVPKEIHKELFDQKNFAVSSYDPWEDIISDYINSIPEYDHGWIKTNDILENILMITVDKRSRKDSMRIGKIMNKLRYEYKTIRYDNVVVKAWAKFNLSPMPFRQSKSEPPQGYGF